MSDNLAGIDFSQYGKWEKITAPTGATYYVVPGTGYVYDPFLSQAKGRPVLWTNPKPSVDAKEKEQAAKDEALKLAKQQASPMGQLLPVAGSVAGLAGGSYLVNALGPKSAAERGVTLAESLATKEAASPVAQGVANAAPAVPAAPVQAFTQSATPMVADATGAVPVGTSLEGGTLMSDGSVTVGNSVASTQGAEALMPYQEGLTANNVFSAAAAVKGAYDSFQGLQHGGEGLRTGTTELGAGIGGLIGGPLGAGAGALVGNTIGYGLQGTGWKNDAALLLSSGGIAAPLVVARHLGFNPIHKTTKQHEQERWGELVDNGVKGAAEAYALSHPEGDTSVYQEGPRKGETWNFETAQEDAKKNPVIFHTAYGNYKTFGNDWDTYTTDQKNQIVLGLIDAGLYDPDKGDITISDEEKAREIKDKVLAAEKTALPPPDTRSRSMGERLASRMNARR